MARRWSIAVGVLGYLLAGLLVIRHETPEPVPDTAPVPAVPAVPAQPRLIREAPLVPVGPVERARQPVPRSVGSGL